MRSVRALVPVCLAALGVVLGATWLFDRVMGSKPYAVRSETQRSRVEIIQACNAHVQTGRA